MSKFADRTRARLARYGRLRPASLAPDHRAAVGPRETFDVVAASQFHLLTELGLRESHFLLDIGCGSLRGGRLFIPYLLPGRYFGLEPERWLVDAGIEHELGRDLMALKRPVFRYGDDFRLTAFGRRFDFLLAQSIFSHASLSQIRVCLGEAAKVMGPSSTFAATFFEGEHDHAGTAWFPGAVRYRFETLLEVSRDAGLGCERLDWPHPNGQTWLRLALAGGGA